MVALRRVDESVADKVKASIGDETFVYGDYARALLRLGSLELARRLFPMARWEGFLHKVKQGGGMSPWAMSLELKCNTALPMSLSIGAGTMGGRWAKRGSRRWQGVLVFRG